MEKAEYIDNIIQLEWKAFDKVLNKGGRASCQNNWSTFSIMRRSQYLTWPKELLESFYEDISTAEAVGRNLIMEKYARMMETTAPEEYQEIETQLPILEEDTKAIINQITAIQVSWMEDFASRYPKMAGQARRIHTSEDTLVNTSYETYLRGELSTYSPGTLLLYGRFITELYKQEKNLAKMIMEQTALLYGFDSLEDAEEKIYGKKE